MRPSFLYMVLILLLPACYGQLDEASSTAKIKNVSNIYTAPIPGDSSVCYFPVRLSAEADEGIDNFKNNWYSRQLFALKEPVINGYNSDQEIYRFTWLRTFHHPIAIRLENRGNEYFVFWKMCDGAGGYQPGELIMNRQKKIGKNTWNSFKAKLAETNFWRLPSHAKEISGKDGAQWILEGRKSGRYHVVDCRSPAKNSKFYRCCDFLIGLTDLNIKCALKY